MGNQQSERYLFVQETRCHGLFLLSTTELEILSVRGFRTAIDLRMILAKLKVYAAIARGFCRDDTKPLS